MLDWPLDQQRKFLTEKIEVAEKDGAKWMLASELSRAQVKRVFAGGKIRSTREQKQCIFDQKNKARWEIQGNKIRIRAGVFSARELQAMLTKLEEP
jgi:RNA:NAD 2'-phosphotransferase (TPT1/KptA family)